MKPDKSDTVVSPEKSKRRYVTKKRILITLTTIVLVLAAVLIPSVFLTCSYPVNLERRIPGDMASITVTDHDGNQYAAVEIGDRHWMAENLRTLHYADGTPIKGVYAYDNDETNVREFGRLYTWETVSSPHGICPAGWHIPTEEEWQALEKHLGLKQDQIEDKGWRGKQSEGIKLKGYESDFLWMDYSKRGVNATGFSALPGGVLTPGGSFMGKGKYADFWSSTASDAETAWNRSLTWINLHPGRTKFYRGNSGKSWSFSLRCIKDQ